MRNHSVTVPAETLERLVESSDILLGCVTPGRGFRLTASEEYHVKRVNMLLDEIQRILDSNV